HLAQNIGRPVGRDQLRPLLAHSSVEPPSPRRPCDRSRMSTTLAKAPGSSSAPGLWAFRSRTTRSCAATRPSLLMPVAMISAAIASPTGPRISTTSSRDSSDIGKTPPVSGYPSPTNWARPRLSFSAVHLEALIWAPTRRQGVPCAATRRLLRWDRFDGLVVARGAPFLEPSNHDEERRHEQNG